MDGKLSSPVIFKNMIYPHVKSLLVFKILRAQPLMFYLPPQGLNQVHEWAVGRQEKKVHALGLPLGHLVLDELRAVPGRVVEHDHRRLLYARREVIEPADDRLRVDVARSLVAGQVSAQVEQPEDVERAALLAADAPLLADAYAAVGHVGQQVEARLVGVAQVDAAH